MRRLQDVEKQQAQFVVAQKLAAARALIARGEYADAERLLTEAQTLDPTNTEVTTELGKVKQWLGRRDA
jgi:Flp pilus assembly protein TadD